MSDELIDRLVGEMAGFEKSFLFAPFKINEPLLDKRTIPLCERMNREVPRATIRIFTNAAALTPDKIEGIAGIKNVAHLWVSLNSHIPERYEQLMKMPFERTAKRLDYLHTVEDFPHKVVLSCVGFPNEDFRRYCFERWPNFESFAIKRTEWLGYTYPQSILIPDAPCGRWFELSIMANGIVSLCCQDATGEYAIGDLNKQSLLEVYNQPSWRKRRETMLSRKQIDAPCSTCTYGG
jgi:radical SAM protein with 4Fe4S-binding SPASM domain